MLLELEVREKGEIVGELEECETVGELEMHDKSAEERGVNGVHGREGGRAGRVGSEEK